MKVFLILFLLFIGCSESNVIPDDIYNECFDSELECDAIYKSVVSSLENAIGFDLKKIDSSTLKMLDGLVETIKLVIRVDENSDLNDLLTSKDSDEMQSILEQSEVEDMFNFIVKLL